MMRGLNPAVAVTVVGLVCLFARSTQADGPLSRRASSRLIPFTPVEIIAKLTASDAAAGDSFGNASISGDTARIGAWGDDTPDGVDAGSVYVFTRIGDTWIEQQKLTASDAEAGDAFGYFPLLVGDTAFIGAIWDDHSGFQDAGSVYVFTRSGDTWTERQKLTASDPDDYPAFGSSLALSGDTLAVGTCDWASSSPDQGSAHVFVRTGDTWSLQQVLTASDGEDGDIFGCDVAILHETIAVSAPWDDYSGYSYAGSVYIFMRTGSSWSETQKLTPGDPASGKGFKFPTILADTMMISADYDDHSGFGDAGSVYVFTRAGDTWTEQQKLTASDPGTGDHFGTDIALSEQIVLIGSPMDDHPGMTNAGSVYVFARYGDTWTEVQKVLAPDAAAEDQFGFPCKGSGDIIPIWASGDDHTGFSDAGSTYLLQLPIFFDDFDSGDTSAWSATVP